jgi:hypothetical protein
VRLRLCCCGVQLRLAAMPGAGSHQTQHAAQQLSCVKLHASCKANGMQLPAVSVITLVPCDTDMWCVLCRTLLLLCTALGLLQCSSNTLQ